MKVAIIGAGSMGGTAARSFATCPLFSPDDIIVTAIHQKTLDAFEGTGIHTTLDNKAAVRNADVIILAVRPECAEEVSREVASVLDFANQVVISFIAGIPSSKYVEWFDNTDFDRLSVGMTIPNLFLAMPNTAMELNEGLTFIAPVHATPVQICLVKAIFDSVGKSVIINEEMMNAGMALASCGVAYAMKYILASVEGGKQLGFSTEEAIKVVVQTVKGAAMLVTAHGSAPEVEIAKIATPGGYTEKGLREMENSDFTAIVHSALEVSSR